MKGEASVADTACPQCGKAAPWLLSSADRNRRVSSTQFEYHRCPACGLVFLRNPPADLGRYYAGGYQAIPDSVESLRAAAEPERDRLVPLRSKAGGDLLEVGPWIGLFTIHAKDAGFRVEVIERSPEAAAFLREKVGVSVTETDDVEAALLQRGKSYDAIVFWHSLEHLFRPWAVLQAAARLLNPGGVLLVAIPNIDSTQARLLTSRWWHLDAPRHLHFWAPRDLAALVEGFGLRTVQLDTDDRLSRQLATDAWINYVRQLVRVPVLRGVIALAVTPMARWLSEGRPSRGAGLTALFERPSSGDVTSDAGR